MSTGRAFTSTAVWMVCALSAAEIPVVTPSAASIETVKLVPILVPFFVTIGSRLSCLPRSSVNVKQIKPRPCLAIKLMSDGVTNCAAMTKSPSFSRSSSSSSTTIRPWRISSIISIIGLIVTVGFSNNSNEGIVLTCSKYFRLTMLFIIYSQ